MIVVDASVWVSLLVPTDAWHDESERWHRAAIARGDIIVAPQLLEVEIAGAVARLTGEPVDGYQAVQNLYRTPGLMLVPIDRSLGALAVRIAADLRLRGADATYVAVASRHGAPLATWDREQLDRAASTISVMTPQPDRLDR